MHTQLDPSLPGSSVDTVRWTLNLHPLHSNFKVLRGGTQACASCADPTSIPFTLLPPVPASRSAYLKCTASAWEEVNFDLGGWLGWELKGSTVEPKSVVSTLVLSV